MRPDTTELRKFAIVGINENGDVRTFDAEARTEAEALKMVKEKFNLRSARIV